MARTWRSLGRQLADVAREQGAKVVTTQAPKLAKQLQKSAAVQRALESASKASSGRPVASTAAPTGERARKVVYAPQLDGKADPGEIVWVWVTFEENDGGKDRPVLVVGRERDTLLGLMLSSNPRHELNPNWMHVGAGPWDHENRPSWVRLDRVLEVPEAGIRREGAILDRERFDTVAARLMRDFAWS